MLPKIERILYCTDMSKNSEYACQYAFLLARETGADIYVLYVAEKPSADAMVTLETYIKDFDGHENFLNDRLAQTKQRLTERMHAYLDSLPEEEKTGSQTRQVDQRLRSTPGGRDPRAVEKARL